MNAVEDVFGKHGVLPSSATKGRKKVEPKPAEPLWKSLKVGDMIEIQAPTRQSDAWLARTPGIYEVREVDAAARKDLPIRVESSATDSGGWVFAEQIVRVVRKAGERPAPVEESTQTLGDILQSALAKRGAPISPIRPIRGDMLIHVDIATILANRQAGEHRPVTVTRRLAEIGTPHVARELAWDGPSRFVHHEFMKIEGTDIQNWVETDSPITCWRDDEGLVVMSPRPGESPDPMMQPILGGFVIHIAAPVLIRNRKEGRNDPVIAVRKAFTNWASDVVFARKVEWSGPTRMVHRPSTPVPGTEGRGVAFIETDADLTLFIDNAPPMRLSMPQRLAA